MGIRKLSLCVVATSVIWVIALAFFEFALLVALVASVRNGDIALNVVFASCSALFVGANYVFIRFLVCEAADYKRNGTPGQNRHRNSSVLSDQRILSQD